MEGRETGAIRTKTELVAIIVNYENRREVLGYYIRESEAKINWFKFLETLNNRGACKANIWICNAHKKLNNAIYKMFHGQLTQRCMIH